MNPLVRINKERRILVEVSRTKTKVRCITPERDVRVLPLSWTEWYGSGPNKVARERRFDEEWRPLTLDSGESYPVERCLFRWLELDNNRTAPLTERARKEIIMLIVTKDNKFVGKFASNDASTAGAHGSIHTDPDELAARLSGAELAILYTNVTGKPVSGGRVKNKQKAAEEIWAAVEAQPATVRVATQPKGERKMGIKQQIRAKLEAGEHLSMDDLVAEFGEDKKVSITTALSDLRSEKYCGEGGPLAIVRGEDKAYHLEGK